MTRPYLAAIVSIGLVLAGAAPIAQGADADRFAGQDRFATAAAISQRTASGPVERVYVANARDFADGLTGAAAAAGDAAPLLLVERNRIPRDTASELRRLQPNEVIVLGGPHAVDSPVVDALSALPGQPTVDRWAGEDRYSTSATISAHSTAAGVDVVYVASGADHADALSAAAVAGAAKTSVLLVKQDAVPSAVGAEIDRLSPGRIVVTGGPERISRRVVDELGRHADTVTRIAGEDRYATSTALARDAYPARAATVFLASGTDFPDALAGATAATHARGPVLLVQGSRFPRTVATELARLAPSRVVALGGVATVSEAALQAATAAAAGEPLRWIGDGDQMIAEPSASLAHLQRRATEMGANELFVTEMTPALYRVAVRYGIDPTVMVAQSFHETGGGHFGRAVTPAHHNTCGLKVRNPVGPDDNPDDHATFASWEQGATAHAQHLYAYAGLPLPDGERNVDPRWDWVYGKHQVTRMTELSGKWAPSPTYGERVHLTALRLLEG